MPLEMPEEEIKKKFPNLAKELENSAEEGQEIKAKPSPSGYEPNVFDFLARCENNSQAIEIVDYLEKRGELPKTEADSLRKRINEKGVRSMVKKRSPGHYFREYGD